MSGLNRRVSRMTKGIDFYLRASSGKLPYGGALVRAAIAIC